MFMWFQEFQETIVVVHCARCSLTGANVAILVMDILTWLVFEDLFCILLRIVEVGNVAGHFFNSCCYWLCNFFFWGGGGGGDCPSPHWPILGSVASFGGNRKIALSIAILKDKSVSFEIVSILKNIPLWLINLYIGPLIEICESMQFH